MSWLQRAFVEQSGSSAQQSKEQQIPPGLEADYDQEIREEAGMRMPPPPPECMGLQGEYDASGLAKRVAVALEQDPVASEIEGLRLIQSGDVIIFEGKVNSQIELEHIIDLARHIDGTKNVEAERVQVQSPA
jgi:hypothetical protein